MTNDWYHLVEDVVIARRLSPAPQMRCVCCGEWYPRGRFRCCAPPAGWRSQAWLALSCPAPSHGGCGRCFRHCQCEGKAERRGAGSLSQVARQFLEDLRRMPVTGGTPKAGDR